RRLTSWVYQIGIGTKGRKPTLYRSFRNIPIFSSIPCTCYRSIIAQYEPTTQLDNGFFECIFGNPLKHLCLTKIITENNYLPCRNDQTSFIRTIPLLYSATGSYCIPDKIQRKKLFGTIVRRGPSLSVVITINRKYATLAPLRYGRVVFTIKTAAILAMRI